MVYGCECSSQDVGEPTQVRIYPGADVCFTLYMQHERSINSSFIFTRSTFCWDDLNTTLHISRTEVIAAQQNEIHGMGDRLMDIKEIHVIKAESSKLLEMNGNYEEEIGNYIKTIALDVSVVRDGRPAGVLADSIDASIIYSGKEDMSLRLM